MATSIHVYDDIETFNKVYKGWLLEPLKNVKIKDMYIYDKRKLWVVTNTNDQKEQPRLQHSLVHFRNGPSRCNVVLQEGHVSGISTGFALASRTS